MTLKSDEISESNYYKYYVKAIKPCDILRYIMTSQEIKNRIMELEVIIKKLEEADKVEEMLNAIDEQL